jgi:hypothetical protein
LLGRIGLDLVLGRDPVGNCGGAAFFENFVASV